MGFFDKAKCLVGVHDFSSWGYQSSTSCIQQRHCKRNGCSKTQSQTQHDWTKFEYVSEGSCEQERDCLRCMQKEKQKVHDAWSDWRYLKSDECGMERKCERCKEVAYMTGHLWEVWNYESPTSCTQIRFCRRCNEKDVKIPEKRDHQWEKQRASCQLAMNECKRCKKWEFVNAGFAPLHIWGEWRRTYDGKLERKCKECEATERRASG